MAAFATPAQAVHSVPHAAAVLQARHAPPLARKPGSQWKPHRVPSQVGAAFAGAWHGVQALPQLAVEVFETHSFPQRW